MAGAALLKGLAGGGVFLAGGSLMGGVSSWGVSSCGVSPTGAFPLTTGGASSRGFSSTGICSTGGVKVAMGWSSEDPATGGAAEIVGSVKFRGTLEPPDEGGDRDRGEEKEATVAYAEIGQWAWRRALPAL